jgi:hypothetical protein
MWVWEKMVLKCELPKSIPLHEQGLNCGPNIYELEDHVKENGLSSNWLTKFGPAKKIPPIFPSHLLKSIWIESTFPYALSPHHEEAMRNTIGVVRKTSAKLPNCTGLALAYPMENKMPLIHQAI